MATEEVKVVEQSPLEKKPEEAEGEVSVELPAPSGWKKKVLPKKGRTPGRDDVIFIAPSGEEIKTKRQLNQYLKSNPGGPAASEFDWSTGETPRRSVRISEKAKSTESPEDEPPKKKRGRKPLSEKKKEEQEEKDNDAEPMDEKKEDTEVKEKDNDAEPMDEKKEENEEKDAGAVKVGDAEMKDAEAVEVAANPATAEPENNPAGKVQENNEGKHAELPSADAAPVENNIGLQEGSDAKPAGSDALPLENKEINGTKRDEPTGPVATSFQNNIGAEVGPQDGFNVNGINY